MSRVLRGLGVLVLVALGIVLYAMCIDMFGGYPQVHSELLTRVAIGLLIVGSIAVWAWHSRVSDDDDDFD
ncbi:hypothetical protein [Flexivirga meconopsidis]|uniref:hypothetical protein n=1 Tax=Flexivirga meconopsidis TaxID=2977121 RepID=UPI00223E96DA|nr:hypothetical protein [Flexivirga meconopsidis]